MTQYARPDADQAVGSWTTAPLWSKVDDDISGGGTGDDVKIASDAVGNGSSTTNADLGLSILSDPVTDTGHILTVRWNNGGEGGSGRNIIGHCELWEGVPGTGTLRAEVAAPTLLGADTTEVATTHTLTSGEADAITNYGDLFIRLWGSGSGPGPSRSLQVEAVQFEVPDAAVSGWSTEHFKPRENVLLRR